jgi:hypothetical protein
MKHILSVYVYNPRDVLSGSLDNKIFVQYTAKLQSIDYFHQTTRRTGLIQLTVLSEKILNGTEYLKGAINFILK